MKAQNPLWGVDCSDCPGLRFTPSGLHSLRYDPGAPPGRPVQVCHEGRQIQLAKPVDLHANCFVKLAGLARQ